jgi:hypothetical protein
MGARMDDMASESDLYMDSDSDEEICIDDRIGKLPSHQEPLSGSEDSRDEEQVASGRLEATKLWVLLCHSLVQNWDWQSQILHVVPPPWNY